jgi:hypothetical protein
MPRLRVPLDELRLLAAQFQSLATEVLDIHTRLSAAAGRLDPAARQKASLDEHLNSARGIRELSEGAEALGQQLRRIIAAFEEADGRGAAAVPKAPRAPFSLPPAMPPARPWPYSPLPALTVVRAAQDSTNGKAEAGRSADGEPSYDSG